MKIRYSKDRGYTDESWLKSRHSFSVAGYRDKNWHHFGPLRVINEDWVAPGKGFGMHPHQNMEIITVMLSGELTHKDNLGNEYALKAGEVQLMTAGTGIFHSEWNNSTETAHLLQIWIHPEQLNLIPSYRNFELSGDSTKLIAGEGALKINSPVKLYRQEVEAGNPIVLGEDGVKNYIHFIEGDFEVAGEKTVGGDAVLLENETVEISAQSKGEVLVIQINN